MQASSLLPISDAKSMSLEVKSDTAADVKTAGAASLAKRAFAIPDDIRTGLSNRLKKSIELEEKEINALKESIAKILPVDTLLEFKEKALEIQKILIDKCFDKKATPEDFKGLNDEYQNSLNTLKVELSKRPIDIIKDRIEKPVILDKKEDEKSEDEKAKEAAAKEKHKKTIATKTKELEDKLKNPMDSYLASFVSFVATGKNFYKKLASWSSESEKVDTERAIFEEKKVELGEKIDDSIYVLKARVKKLTELKQLCENASTIYDLKGNEALKAYFTEKSQVKKIDEAKYTALHYCSAFDDLELAKILINEKNVTKDRKNKNNGCLPFHLVLPHQTESTKAFLQLLQPSTNEILTAKYSERTALAIAAYYDNAEAFIWLLTKLELKGTDLIEACKDIFHEASKQGRTQIVDLLFPIMQEANLPMKEFQRALLSAYLNKQPKVRAIFFEYGCHLDKLHKVSLATQRKELDESIECFRELQTFIQTDIAEFSRLAQHVREGHLDTLTQIEESKVSTLFFTGKPTSPKTHATLIAARLEAKPASPLSQAAAVDVKQVSPKDSKAVPPAATASSSLATLFAAKPASPLSQGAAVTAKQVSPKDSKESKESKLPTFSPSTALGSIQRLV